ncbi:methyltransferase domain-containing protein [archaeon]|nr:MAG: methyltransferase domain-containing protein [archaeon]
MVLVAFVVSVGLAVLGQAFLHQVPRFGSRTSSPPYSSQVDDKAVVMQYFNNEGFDRWSKIYSESGEVNKVQLDIRTGHQQIIDKVLGWIENEDNRKKTVCDVGCGVGSLSIPMASKFKLVYASDISAAMTFEAHSRAQFRGVRNMQVETKDMDNLTGSYDTVTCIDVMIHYPSDKVGGCVGVLIKTVVCMYELG